ncbi:NMD3 family-domain-containing protein [Aspergillus pseudoustus]|uniref:60S ribosomal export protein NMD3 n=1 Tax=Aspergillus pseudoustus TaxID=1810923 RepID=A0ABR4J9C7_9EURO
MDIDTPVPLAPQDESAGEIPTVLCYNCGAPLVGTTICNDCMRLQVDISQGIQREAVLNFCRDCERWLLPPSSWNVAALESRELLALCLKKLKGLNKIRVIDAGFIWTEPHSRRVKVKLTIQDSVNDGVILQQTFEVVYIVMYQQCPECAKSYTPNTWRASVQVRQQVLHKRTFLYLEQLILKHKAHQNTINIKEAKHGIDFFFAQRNHAEGFLDFLHSAVPVEVTKSQQIISEDIHTSTKSYKFTYSAKIVPVCKDDLVALPIKLAKQLGNISPLLLCTRIGTSISFLDPNTLQTADLNPRIYWRAPFTSLADARELVEFIVLDVEPTGHSKGKYFQSEVTVARASDFSGDKQYFTRTHLGSIIHPGDSVLGYMLTGANFNNMQFDEIESSSAYSSTIPDVLLVKKYYPRRSKHTKRSWKLKRMATEHDPYLLPNDKERVENDFEMFLRDVEEDQELRQTLAVYKNAKKKDGDAMSVAETDMMNDDEDEIPKISMDELLDDFDDLDIDDKMDG